MNAHVFRPRRSMALVLAAALAALSPPLAAQVYDCTLGGAPVNPNNGHSTAGKTGLMRCVERDGSRAYETEYRDGRRLGLQRWYEAGTLRREHSVNARGNDDGLAREWNEHGVLVREGRASDGRDVGLHRAWHADGTLRRVAFWDEAGERRSEADSVMEFDRQGRLETLRCGAVPRLDGEARLCGHDGAPGTAELFSNGRPATRIVHVGGRLVRSEGLWPDGSVRRLQVRDGGRTTITEYAQDGTRRAETVTEDGRRVLEATFTERGTPLRERRWRDGTLEREAEWYLNGQPRWLRVHEVVVVDGPSGPRTRAAGHVDRRFADDGRLSSEGRWARPAGDASGRTVPVGAHRDYDERGRLRAERVHDERGRLVRERDWDESGRLLRDDEVYEDGSRKRTAPDGAPERSS